MHSNDVLNEQSISKFVNQAFNYVYKGGYRALQVGDYTAEIPKTKIFPMKNPHTRTP